MPREYMPTPRERWESSLSALADAVDRLANALGEEPGPSILPAADPRQGRLRLGIVTVRARVASMACMMEVAARRSAESAGPSGQETIDQAELEDLTRRSDELRARVAPLLDQATALVRRRR